MKTDISNGSRSNPENLPVQTRMTPFQIAALKALASVEGVNSSTLLRTLVDRHIEHCLIDGDPEVREIVVKLLKRAGYTDDLTRIALAAIRQEAAGNAGQYGRLSEGERLAVSRILGIEDETTVYNSSSLVPDHVPTVVRRKRPARDQ